ncbi:MAG: DUF3551 domain-containing protein [Rhizobiales bacterium]|nr:DUF3551 domain-containing protein [Hyphomicrobiales bacterium]
MADTTIDSSGAVRSRLRRASPRRLVLAALIAALGLGGLLLPGLGMGTAHAQVKADPYRWCADFGGRGGGGTSCYYMSFEQCRRELIGRGGICRPNPFYTGVPRATGRHGKRRYHRYDD